MELTAKQKQAIRKAGNYNSSFDKTKEEKDQEKVATMIFIFILVASIPVIWVIMNFGFIVGLLFFGLLRVLWFIFVGFFGLFG